MTDLEVKGALTDGLALALTLWGEGRGEPIEGRIAVASVIRNRVLDPRRFGRSYRAVCLQRGQFSCWWNAGGAANYEATMDQARRLLAEPWTPPRDRVLRECLYLNAGIIGGDLLDRVNGARHYYAPNAMRPRGRVPSWAKGLTPVASVGAHLFFAGVR